MLKVTPEQLGSVTVLHLGGRIVIGPETIVLWEAALAQAQAAALILDLANVSLIDARGLGVLLELRQWTQANGIEFRLKNVTRLVRQVLELTCLDTVFEISSQHNEPPVTKQEIKSFRACQCSVG